MSWVRWDGHVTANAGLLHLHSHYRVAAGSAQRERPCGNARCLRARSIEGRRVILGL